MYDYVYYNVDVSVPICYKKTFLIIYLSGALEKLYNDASDLQTLLALHGSQGDDLLMGKAADMEKTLTTLSEVLRHSRKAITEWDHVSPESVDEATVQKAESLHTTLSTHATGLKDLMKRYKAMLPSKE